ncbi:Hypothetical protein SRAE_2000444300 [Strongyloides ratti]|uniref:Uncharacterized protein n=1 Tax=Strongyloides ratti TaxID=34506 RepID=A0A090LJ10_STRRB|nr:Hypothetical protein SRAE_2000444300 [Strongyloides ratti]CEF69797.1 Hypothetical protein SRAE_2000444300 [Strongyloides ratti]
MYQIDVINDLFNEKNENSFEQFISNHFPKEKVNNLLKKSEIFNPFNEYFSRGMFQCSRSYISFIAKMHVLIKDVYKTFNSCQKSMYNIKSKDKDNVKLLDETLAKYKLDSESIAKMVKERKIENVKQ